MRVKDITQLSIAYISLINSVNNIAERDQFLGRPIIFLTDKDHIITKNPLLSPYMDYYVSYIGAGNEVRTRDLNLGKVALYQLSYSRLLNSSKEEVCIIQKF